jgi:hypothetical protein
MLIMSQRAITGLVIELNKEILLATRSSSLLAVRTFPMGGELCYIS